MRGCLVCCAPPVRSPASSSVSTWTANDKNTLLADAACAPELFAFLLATAPSDALDLGPLPPTGTTALMYVLYAGRWTYASPVRTRIQQDAVWLIDRMSDGELNAVDAQGHTALPLACTQPDAVVLQRLLRRVPGVELEPERAGAVNGRCALSATQTRANVGLDSALPPPMSRLLRDAHHRVAEYRAQLTALLGGERLFARLLEANTTKVAQRTRSSAAKPLAATLPFAGLPHELIAIVIAYL